MRRPRSLSSVGRKLLPAMIWYLPLASTRFCSQRMIAAVITSTVASTVAVRIDSKLPALWWIFS